IYCGKVGEGVANRINSLTSKNVKGFNISVSSDFENSHYDEKEKEQIDITFDVVARFPEIVADFDDIEVTHGGKAYPYGFKFTKRFIDSITAIAYVATGKKDIRLQTMYGKRIEKNPANMVNASNDADTITPVTIVGTDSDYRIAADKEKVNEKSINSKKQFSLKSPVESVGDLVAIHNMHESDLIKTLKLGGFPMPSIAVMRADNAGQSYRNVNVL
ncbi:MAG: hypothetical protein J6Z46_09770, partial [Lachnospiraceae bacterium]|nr:hypothetical protein [Lachnospiraceae bacterium]